MDTCFSIPLEAISHKDDDASYISTENRAEEKKRKYTVQNKSNSIFSNLAVAKFNEYDRESSGPDGYWV